MDNVKNILSIDPFKTYLIGYYAVNGGTFTDQETGEVKGDFFNLSCFLIGEFQLTHP